MCEYGFEECKDFNMLKNERVQIEGRKRLSHKNVRKYWRSAIFDHPKKGVILVTALSKPYLSRSFTQKRVKPLNGRRMKHDPAARAGTRVCDYQNGRIWLLNALWVKAML